jgi:hypothetical protein
VDTHILCASVFRILNQFFKNIRLSTDDSACANGVYYFLGEFLLATSADFCIGKNQALL